MPPAKVVVPVSETINLEVEAMPLTAKKVVVAWLMETLARVVKPETFRTLAEIVEEACKIPITCKGALIVEEAEEINPLDMVICVVEAVAKAEWPLTARAVRVPTLVKEEAATPVPKVLEVRTVAPLRR